LRVLPNAYPPIMISRNQLMLEDRIRRILAALAEEVRTGEAAAHRHTPENASTLQTRPDPDRGGYGIARLARLDPDQ
jgi:hypothetical protein